MVPDKGNKVLMAEKDSTLSSNGKGLYHTVLLLQITIS